MKAFAILIIVCSAVVVKAAMTEEQMQAFKKILTDCAEKEKAGQEDIDDFLAKKPAIKREAKCHRACLHETFGTMKDNKFSGEGFIAMMTKKFDGDAAKMQSVRDVASDCADQQDADRCEAGAKICKCLAEKTKARGLNV